MTTWYTSNQGEPVEATEPEWRAAAPDFDRAAALAGFAQPKGLEFRNGVGFYEHETAASWLFTFGHDRAHVVLVEGFPEFLWFQATLAPLVTTGFQVRAVRR